MGDRSSLADEALQRGDFDACRSILIEEVKRNPADHQARMFLFQLLAVCGEWEKSGAQLRALAKLEPQTQLLANAYGSALEGEALRARLFAGAGPPRPHLTPSDWVKKYLDAHAALAAGRVDEALELRHSAYAEAPETPAVIDGIEVGWLSDADAWIGPFVEAMVNGAMGVIPFVALAEISFEPPGDLRDLVWAAASLTLKSGQSTAALIPVRYAGTERSANADERLARATRFIDRPEGERGQGQRLWVSDGDSEFPLLGMRKVAFR